MTVLVACSENNVKLNELVSFSKVKTETEKTYTDELEVEIFRNAIEHAIKLDGIVDVVDPMYKFKLDGKEYFLWLHDAGGSIMETNDTHTIYKLLEEDAKQLKEVVNL